MRYLMRFSYDGSSFSGYQKQPNKRTIQGEIEKVLYQVNGNQPVSLVASGRTDAKVHAYNQSAHFDLQKTYDSKRLLHALNKMLPKDIYIRQLEVVPPEFHARFDVIKKQYCYKINLGEYNPLERAYVYQYGKNLAIEKMKEASNFLLGTHDFRSFTKQDEEKEDYRRTLYAITYEQQGSLLCISFCGSGFLRYMVRNLVGTLIEIGNGKRLPSSIPDILNAKDRSKAGMTAPPEGLYLQFVEYESEVC